MPTQSPHSRPAAIERLPKDAVYTVTENPTESQRIYMKTKVSHNGGDAVTSLTQSGVIGDNTITTDDGVSYTSDVAYVNSFAEIVCKITNSSRVLMYYEDGGALVPAIFVSPEA